MLGKGQYTFVNDILFNKMHFSSFWILGANTEFYSVMISISDMQQGLQNGCQHCEMYLMLYLPNCSTSFQRSCGKMLFFAKLFFYSVLYWWKSFKSVCFFQWKIGYELENEQINKTILTNQTFLIIPFVWKVQCQF